jgi:hypothetical protein
LHACFASDCGVALIVAISVLCCGVVWLLLKVTTSRLMALARSNSQLCVLCVHSGTRAEAEAILNAEEAGSFIIRPSSQPNCLALSHKVSNGSIGHALIHHTPQGYRLEQTQNSFPSLELLVLSIKKHFTVNDSMSTFGQTPAPAAGNGTAK